MSRGFLKTNNLTKDTLLKLAQAGCFIIAATSPFFLTGFLKEYFRDFQKRITWRRAQKLKELEKKKIVSFKELSDGSIKIELTHQGKTLIRRYQLEDLKINKPKVWDKKWHLIIYDIPHCYRKARDAFREKIKQLGLYQLQKSVWVSAYDCLPEIEFLAGVFDLNLNKYIFHFTSTEIPKEKEIKKWFDLV